MKRGVEMAQSPKYKVYRDKEYIGCVKYAEDAAALVAIQDNGSVRLGHSFVLWNEGVDGNAGDSYDVAAEKMREREHEANAKAYAKAYGRS
jgi:hypothetical protein